MTVKPKLPLSLPVLGGFAVFALGLLSGVVFSLYRVQALESEIGELRLAVDRARARAAEAVAASEAVPPAAAAVAPEELDEVRAELGRVRQAVADLADRPAGTALAAVPPPEIDARPTAAADEAQARPADEQVAQILATLESQDQSLLKGVVQEILNQKAAEDREKRIKRQSQDMVKQLTKALSLSAQQAAQVGPIVLDRMKQVEDLRAKVNDQNRAAIKNQIQQVRREGEEQLSHVLTATQLTKYKDWQAREEKRLRAGR